MSRYRPDFRKNELTLVLKQAYRGNSLCLVGIAGTGKSNIVRVLRDEMETKRRLLGAAADTLLVVDVNAIRWDGTPADLWKLMNDALLPAAERNGLDLSANNIRTLKDRETRALELLQANITWLTQQEGRKVLFVLDDFDRVLLTGPLPMLETLSDLRSAGNRERLSYLVMTKRLPHILGRRHRLEQQSKFYDLFRNRIYGLGMYDDEDALQMVRHLNELHDRHLSSTEMNYLLWVAGGHAGLIRAVFDAWHEAPPSMDEPEALIEYFSTREEVRQECRRILLGLHPHERRSIARLAATPRSQQDAEVIRHFDSRGLLVRPEPLTWFSPLFGHYVVRVGEDAEG